MKSSDKEKKFSSFLIGDFVSFYAGEKDLEDYGYVIAIEEIVWCNSANTSDDVETENLRICEYEDVPANYLLQLLEKLSCVSRKSDRS